METARVVSPDRQLVEEIIHAGGFTVSELGLRFDRVAQRTTADLKRFADGAAPDGMTILVTLTAPIRNPALTVEVLKQEIRTLLTSRNVGKDYRTNVHGNDVRIRFVRNAQKQHTLIGLVHNSERDTTRLLELAEHWLSASS